MLTYIYNFIYFSIQTYRECVRLSEGSGLQVHVLTKATASANSFGPQSSLKFGELNHPILYIILLLSLKLISAYVDILVTTPNRLVHMLSLDPPAIVLDK